MGGVGFSELLLLALITLLVVGPQRLPEIARTVGRWTRHARSAWASLKSEFQDEMDRDHNRRILEATEAHKQSECFEREPHERRDDAD
ncbi:MULTISPECIES: Sec-independent protein translocase protein TatB [unclassified Wenzhouxiangella]|uniref:Sec-independent protein translocase protein TatB n=1 Tax=unclassified Wenzhouxiangella TaxID=2613841 RepID=UPI000E32D198|nr:MULTISPECIES: Sec-independent protein translocase protein TatB [unclassified Wenzhouxiangella]RFF27179.1 twin-arginine translocase subunit TatB [Wenzhouxiangella sp. 15181]RFP69134.1 twin-arginine translocase subunit TatB [Wenzhouxiangella sp. 15190]